MHPPCGFRQCSWALGWLLLQAPWLAGWQAQVLCAAWLPHWPPPAPHEAWSGCQPLQLRPSWRQGPQSAAAPPHLPPTHLPTRWSGAACAVLDPAAAWHTIGRYTCRARSGAPQPHLVAAGKHTIHTVCAMALRTGSPWCRQPPHGHQGPGPPAAQRERSPCRLQLVAGVRAHLLPPRPRLAAPALLVVSLSAQARGGQLSDTQGPCLTQCLPKSQKHCKAHSSHSTTALPALTCVRGLGGCSCWAAADEGPSRPASLDGMLPVEGLPAAVLRPAAGAAWACGRCCAAGCLGGGGATDCRGAGTAGAAAAGAAGLVTVSTLAAGGAGAAATGCHCCCCCSGEPKSTVTAAG